jgi:hypothetical protein
LSPIKWEKSLLKSAAKFGEYDGGFFNRLAALGINLPSGIEKRTNGSRRIPCERRPRFPSFAFWDARRGQKNHLSNFIPQQRGLHGCGTMARIVRSIEKITDSENIDPNSTVDGNYQIAVASFHVANMFRGVI